MPANQRPRCPTNPHSSAREVPVPAPGMCRRARGTGWQREELLCGWKELPKSQPELTSEASAASPQTLQGLRQKRLSCDPPNTHSPVHARGVSYLVCTLLLTTLILGRATGKNGWGLFESTIHTAVPSESHTPPSESNSPNKGNPVINTQQIYKHILLSCTN